MSIRKLGEFGLISQLREGLISDNKRVVRGIGDDTAVLHHSRDQLLLATCDAQIEGVHFVVDAFTKEQIGRRAAAVNLSDIAAMGGKPTFALISLAVPKETETAFLEGVYAGLKAGFHEWDVEIVGGNTARLDERIVIDVHLLGEVAPKKVLMRNGAMPDDLLCVTGALGASAAGLRLVREPQIEVDPMMREQALNAYLTPIPRVREGMFLGASGNVTACIDVSDGLLGDSMHLAEESSVKVAIDLDRMPVAPAARSVADSTGADGALSALNGGEDFELLFTIRPDTDKDFPDRFEQETGTRATVIGEIREGASGVEVRRAGQLLDLHPAGFDHFTSGD